jgi:NAD(P)H-hydrate epimerase
VGDDWKIIRKRKAGTVVTPHPGEMGRLVKKTADEVQSRREELAKKYASVSGAVVVLKGAGTVVTDGSDVVINETGNVGMATAGSGDVLAGIIAGLLAQGMDAYPAARLGTHLHGMAGDIASRDLGQHSVIAGDVLERVPHAFQACDESERA